MNLVKRNAPSTSWPMLLDNLFNRDAFKEGNLNFYDTHTEMPAVNIRETADSFSLELAAPGMSKSDFKIELDNKLLTISAEKSNETNDSDNGTYSRKEFSYQSLKRSFNLPAELIDAEQINAKYEAGILYVTLPKREEAINKGVRQIQIS